jgi:hypothetical protein
VKIVAILIGDFEEVYTAVVRVTISAGIAKFATSNFG